MASRCPPEAPANDAQSEILRAVQDALNEAAPADAQPLAEQAPSAQLPQEPLAETAETQPGQDRTEVYLKGPTAFTA